MDIGIIDADMLNRATRHPNLSCLKLSGYHKLRGDNVKLLEDWGGIADFDRVYIAKVFDYSKVPFDPASVPNVVYGGTGFFFDAFCDGGEHMLPYDVEHTMPDYHLYDAFVEKHIASGEKRSRWKDYLDYSMGFTTRGCFRHCKFCVNQHSDGVKFHAHVREFLDQTRKYIHLWDDNILGYPKWREVFEELAETGKAFRYRQGMDVRLLTDEKAKVLANAKYHKDYTFAFDHPEEHEIIIRGLKTWHRWSTKTPQFYVLCGFDNQDERDIEATFFRIGILIEYRGLPYIMRHEFYQHSRYRGMYINLARWCNQPSFFKKKSFREFCEANGEKSACYRYMKEFEHDHPEIAAKYFDMRWGDYAV